MKKRLEAIRRLIPDGRGVIDVGTDHGYLPVQLYKDGYPGVIFASDLRFGPLSAAKARAEREGAGERIRFFLCDGLADCPPKSVDTIVIAGMGGDTICGILDRAEWCMSPEYLLILQPMTKAEVLRFWLVNNGFLINREELSDDGDGVYQILTARFCDQNTRLSDAELFLGSYALQRDNPLFPKHLAQQRARLETSYSGMCASEKHDAAYLAFLRNIIQEMKQIGEDLYANDI